MITFDFSIVYVLLYHYIVVLRKARDTPVHKPLVANRFHVNSSRFQIKTMTKLPRFCWMVQYSRFTSRPPISGTMTGPFEVLFSIGDANSVFEDEGCMAIL